MVGKIENDQEEAFVHRERKREDLHSAVLQSWCFTSGDRFSRIRIFWTTAGTVTNKSNQGEL